IGENKIVMVKAAAIVRSHSGREDERVEFKILYIDVFASAVVRGTAKFERIQRDPGRRPRLAN
ncbi:MAG: hypothetical protein ABI878_12320, partial [Acidobacteriota bacterium]